MSIASLADWRALVNRALRFEFQSNATVGNTQSLIGGLFDQNTVATPSTNETCDNTHAANQFIRGSGVSGSKLRLLHFTQCNDGFYLNTLSSPPEQVLVVFFDRLAQTAGLSGTETAEQTTNLPGSLPSRASDGVGVCAFLRIWTLLGTTGVTYTCRVLGSDDVEYTTPVQDLTAAKTGAGVMAPIPLPPGVSGIKEVRGVTLSASTGSVGNFGVVYMKPLFLLPVTEGKDLIEDFGWAGCQGFPIVPDEACFSSSIFISAANRIVLANASLAFNYVTD